MPFKTIPAFAFLGALFLVFLSFQSAFGGENQGTQINILHHDIDLTVDIDKQSVSGRDKMTVKSGVRELNLVIRAGSNIDAIEIDGRKAEFSITDIPSKNIKKAALPLSGAEKEVLVRFHGDFLTIENARERITRGVAFVEDGVMGEEGVFLPSSAIWHPQEETGLTRFTLTVTLPQGYSSLSEGALVKSANVERGAVETWREDNPIEGLDLVIGRYTVTAERHKSIDIQTYLFQKDDALSRLYIQKSKGYIDLYEDLIGPYPYRKFAVVESFLPTGYGMPSFTLLGSSVIRLPFIPDTSLGHEIAHNWWGNSVFIDNRLGNWCEALTTFTADYMYERKKGAKEAAAFRFAKLKGYKNFAADNPMALKNFIDATTPASRAVGYNKGVMVFNMLEREVGQDAFRKGLREFYKNNIFKRASWKDIEAAFESASGKDLGRFFEQWVDKAGGPSLSIKDATAKEDGKGYTLDFSITQDAPYEMYLPVVIETESGAVEKQVRVDESVERVAMEIPSRPLSFEIDPEYQNFRMLDDEEIPPSLASFFGDKNGVIVLPNKNRIQEKYYEAARTISDDYGQSIITDSDIGLKDYLKDRSLFILGGPGENLLFALVGNYLSNYALIDNGSFTIGGRRYERAGTVLAVAIKNPHNPSKTIAFLINGADKNAVTEAGRRMRYFSDSSYIVFTGKDRPGKGSFSGKKALRREFSE